MNDTAYHIIAVVTVYYIVHFKFEKSVVDKYARTDIYVVGKVLVCNGYFLVIAGNFTGSEYEILAVLQKRPAALELLYTNLRTFRIEKGSYRKIKLLTDSLYLLEHLLVAFVIAVRKVLARNIHTAQHELAQYFIVRSGRTHSAYYLSFSHLS